MLDRYVDLDTDRMRHGKWQGEDVSDVADEDPDYLRVVLKEEDLLAEDRERIERALTVTLEG